MRTETRRNLKRGFNKFKDNIAPIVLMTIIILILFLILWGAIANELNKISEGTVVDKTYSAPYTSTSDGVSKYHAASCTLTISGEKNGKYVEYTFEVPEAEYVMYNIGDHYPLGR